MKEVALILLVLILSLAEDRPGTSEGNLTELWTAREMIKIIGRKCRQKWAAAGWTGLE